MNIIKHFFCVQPIKYSVVFIPRVTYSHAIPLSTLYIVLLPLEKNMELANAILGDSNIDGGNPVNLSFLQDLMTPALTPPEEFDTFCRVIINAFHQHFTSPLGSIVTDAATQNNDVLSLMWEQATITTQFWHLLANVQRVKSLLPTRAESHTAIISGVQPQSNDGRA